MALAPLSLWRPGNVAMFHVGRSGSRVLASLLGQHPAVRWDGEIYEPNSKLWRPGRDPERLLRRRMRLAGRRYYGFEMKFFHARLMGLALSEFVPHLIGSGFDRFIVLERRNTLRKVVSSIRLHQERRSHRKEGAARLHRIRVDVEDVRIDRASLPLVDHLEGYRRGFEELDHLIEDREVLRLSYEDDIAEDPRIAYQRCCAFLGIEPTPVEVAYGRTNPFPMKEIVINWDDVVRALSDTPFGWMTEE